MSAARQGFMREQHLADALDRRRPWRSSTGRSPGSCPAVPRPIVRRLAAPYIAGPDARRRGSRRPAAERRGEARDGRRARRGDRDGRRGRGDRRGLPRALLERIESERLDANISVKLTGLGLELDERALPRRTSRRSSTTLRVRGNFVRIDMEDSSTTDATLAPLPRAPRRRPRERRRRPPGLPAPDARRRAGPRQRPALQGDLRRAAGDRVPGSGRGPRRASSRRSTRSSTRAPTSGSRPTTSALIGEALRRIARARARARRVRVPDAPRRARRARRRARPRRAPAARLRPVRDALVRVLGPAAPGEPEDRRLRRRRHAPAPSPF